ncbi:phytoene dehydrogenase, partial [Nannochloropsis gaditana CCMP526]
QRIEDALIEFNGLEQGENGGGLVGCESHVQILKGEGGL